MCFLKKHSFGNNPFIFLIILGSVLSQLEIQILIIQKFFFGDIVIPLMLLLKETFSVNVSPINEYDKSFKI